MTTIDHAAEARHILSDIARFRDQHLEVAMISAQVHAQLALVEAQREANEHQRIANLIAWTTANGASPLEHVEAQIEEGLDR